MLEQTGFKIAVMITTMIGGYSSTAKIHALSCAVDAQAIKILPSLTSIPSGVCMKHLKYDRESAQAKGRSIGMMDTGYTIWLTGLSGAGKSTIAQLIEQRLRGRGVKVE